MPVCVPSAGHDQTIWPPFLLRSRRRPRGRRHLRLLEPNLRRDPDHSRSVRAGELRRQGRRGHGQGTDEFRSEHGRGERCNAQALFAAKTVQELVDLQTEISRSGYDSLVTESAKLTELSLALANDAAEPIQARLNATVEKLMKPLAA